QGVNIGIEYEPGLLVEDGTEMRALLQLCPHPRLGLNFDVGHSVVVKEDTYGLIRDLKDRIWNVHLEDIKAGKHWHLIPRRGDIDCGALFREFARAGYTGFLTCELYTYPDDPDGAAREAMAFMKPKLEAALRGD